MTRVYFVRHAQPEHDWKEDRTRPLTEEGKKDSEIVLEFLKDRKIDVFYCSPYKRSMDTIAEAAAFFGKEIITDERLREREKGPDGNNHGMFQKRWADHEYHEEGGESIAMVQKRNMESLDEILSDNQGKEIVVGTHGTALSTILNFYDNSFGCEDFLRIIDWMPYIIELDFEGDKLVGKHEHCHVEKEFKGNQRATMTDFSVNEMLEMQKELQDKYKDKWEPIHSETGKNKLLWMLGEVGEVIDIVKKNGGTNASTNPELRKDLVEELADVLMYYNDVLLCYGISAEELKTAYTEKFKKNMKRW